MRMKFSEIIKEPAPTCQIMDISISFYAPKIRPGIFQETFSSLWGSANWTRYSRMNQAKFVEGSL